MNEAVSIGIPRETNDLNEAIIDDTNVRPRDAALQSSEKKYRSLFQNMTNGVVNVDMQGRIIDSNRSYQRMTGYSEDELRAIHSFNDITPEKWHDMEANIIKEQVIEKGLSCSYEKEYRRKDGTIFPIELRVYLIKNELGEPSGMWAIVRDISERKKAEEILKRERDSAQMYLDLAGFIFIRLDEKGLVTLINKKGCEVLGCEPKDVIGKSWFDDFIPESHRARVKQTFDELKEDNTTTAKNFENIILRGDGKERTIAWHNRILRDDKGVITGTLSSGEDITERKLREEELHQVSEKLSLLSNVTRHDILNEVTVQMGYLNLIKNRTFDQETMTLIEKTRSITGVIRDQIEFTKVYQGTGILVPNWQDIGSIIRSLIIPKGIDLSLDCTEIELLADPMLPLVFYNLLDNMVRHGEHVTNLKVSSSKKAGRLTIVWEDNGIGVEDKEKEMIFQQGFGKNTGLGLSFIKQILGITGISITENGIKGKGARFEIQVPEGAFRSNRYQDTCDHDSERNLMLKFPGLRFHQSASCA